MNKKEKLFQNSYALKCGKRHLKYFLIRSYSKVIIIMNGYQIKENSKIGKEQFRTGTKMLKVMKVIKRRLL